MPSRERTLYAEAFDSNPFEGQSPERVYRQLRWGESVRERWSLVAPEPLAGLGVVARLDYGRVSERYDDVATACTSCLAARTARRWMSVIGWGSPEGSGRFDAPTTSVSRAARTLTSTTRTSVRIRRFAKTHGRGSASSCLRAIEGDEATR